MVIRAAEEASEGDGEGGEGDANTTASGMRRRLGPDDPLPYFGPYFGMTGKALGKECKSRGLKVSGKKMELIERLEEDDAGAVRTQGLGDLVELVQTRRAALAPRRPEVDDEGLAGAQLR